jgi:hypothetical protein
LREAGLRAAVPGASSAAEDQAGRGGSALPSGYGSPPAHPRGRRHRPADPARRTGPRRPGPELLSEPGPLHPRHDTFPGEVFLHLAADAPNWCRASRTNPRQLEGLQARFLPEPSFRGRQNNKRQYAVLAAAALHGGTEPDLLDEVAWRQSDDVWECARYAAVAYIRAAASQAGVPARQARQDLAQRRAAQRHNTHYRAVRKDHTDP